MEMLKLLGNLYDYSLFNDSNEELRRVQSILDRLENFIDSRGFDTYSILKQVGAVITFILL